MFSIMIPSPYDAVLKKNMLKNKNWHLGVEILDLGAFQPAIGRIFHVESEFEVENTRCLRPDTEN